MDIPSIKVSYSETLLAEQSIRHDLYDDEKNVELSQPYFNLLEYNSLQDITVETDTQDILFSRNRLRLLTPKSAYRNLQIDNLVTKLCELDHVLIAGGRVFAAVADGAKFDDYDLFFYNCDAKTAKLIIQKVNHIVAEYNSLDKLAVNNDFTQLSHRGSQPLTNQSIIETYTRVLRTQNAITFQRYCCYLYYDANSRPQNRTIKVCKVQIILRLYKTPSEILHTFDVDSCCLGYDGRNIWLTPRCMFALKAGYNTVNLDLASPSYSSRLIKYAHRGMMIRVPGLSNRITGDELTAAKNWAVIHILCAQLQPQNRNILPSAPTANLTIPEIIANLSESTSKTSKRALLSLLPPLSGIVELLISDAAWNLGYFRPLTKPISDYDQDNQNRRQWLRLSTALHRHLDKLVELQVDQRRLLTWIYNQSILAPMTLDDENIQQVLQFLHGTLSKDFTVDIMNIHEKELQRLADDQGHEAMRTRWFIAEHTKGNLRRHNLDSNWSAEKHRVHLEGNKVTAIGLNSTDFQADLVIPQETYRILGSLLDIEVPAEIQFKTIKPGEQTTSTFNPYDEVGRTLWMDLSRL